MLPLLEDQEARARDLLDPEALAWILDGAVEGEWSSLRLRPHVLRDVATVDTSVTILGTTSSTPVFVAPTANHVKAHSAGEAETYRGAAAAGSLMVWAMRSSAPVAGPCWWQAYVLYDRGVTREKALKARDLGATAIVLTGDTPYLGTARRASLGSLDQSASVSLSDIDWLASETGLPVLVKGVLRADDAVACVEAGAAGIIVSNHGGRQLHRAVSTAQALPEVVDAVSVPVLVDGGLRDGTDVLCALALGASAVLVGKPVLWALAADGAEGVEACLRALTEDLRHVMGLAGVRSLTEINRSLISRRGRAGA